MPTHQAERKPLMILYIRVSHQCMRMSRGCLTNNHQPLFRTKPAMLYVREFRSRFHSMCIREFTRTARTSRMVFLHAIYFYEHRVAHSVNCICSLAQYIYLYARRFSLRGENCKIFVHQLWPRALFAQSSHQLWYVRAFAIYDMCHLTPIQKPRDSRSSSPIY